MSQHNVKKVSGGLRITPYDKADLKLGALFTLPALETIPDEFDIGVPVDYKDQKESDMCPGAGTSAASEYQEGEALSMEAQFMFTKEVSGDPWEDWGGNIRDALQGARKLGSIPLRLVPPHLRFDGSNRDFVANPANWPEELKRQGLAYRKASFWEVIGPYDLFDDIRATMWQSIQLNPASPQAVITGALWRTDWTQPGGIVPKEYGPGEFGHCFIFMGVAMRNGELMLKAQLSNGRVNGDNGFYYFSRDIVNREIPPYKAFVFRDLPAAEAKFLVENNLSLKWHWLSHFVVAIKNIFKK